MHAVLVSATPPATDEARRTLREEVVPRVSAQPGFHAGYWLEPKDGQVLAVVLFDSEADARTAADGVRVPDGVRLDDVEVRAVIASAQGRSHA